MTDTFEFTLDEESEKKLFEIMTNFDTKTIPSFTITDKYGHTSEYVKVVHGEWIDRNGSIVAPFWERYECSECGARSDNSKYCPNCGADMRG